MKVMVQDSTWVGTAETPYFRKERNTALGAAKDQTDMDPAGAVDGRTYKKDHSDTLDSICTESCERSQEAGGSVIHRSCPAFGHEEAGEGRRGRSRLEA